VALLLHGSSWQDAAAWVGRHGPSHELPRLDLQCGAYSDIQRCSFRFTCAEGGNTALRPLTTGSGARGAPPC
jgi:hypothetical protein